MSYDIDNMLEISFEENDDFLKIRETLTRIGVASRKDRTLYQSCHILHKRSKYYLVHFKDWLLYTSPSPRDGLLSRMPSSA